MSISGREAAELLRSVAHLVGSLRASHQHAEAGEPHPYAGTTGARLDAALLAEIHRLVDERVNRAELDTHNGSVVRPEGLRLARVRERLADAFRLEAKTGKPAPEARLLAFGGMEPVLIPLPDHLAKAEPYRTILEFDPAAVEGSSSTPVGGKGPADAAARLLHRIYGVSVRTQDAIAAAARRIEEETGLQRDTFAFETMATRGAFRPQLTTPAVLWTVAQALGFASPAAAADALTSAEAETWAPPNKTPLPCYDHPDDPLAVDWRRAQSVFLRRSRNERTKG